MSINQTSQMPAYCKNCHHRFVCSIQKNIKAQDEDVKQFNSDHVGVQQSVSTINYVCRYKFVDSTS